MSDRDKYLTEAMGWIECDRWTYYNPYSVQKTCEHENCYPKQFPCKYDTWQGFGTLWEWAIKQEWWASFNYEPDLLIGWVKRKYINPDKFADALYEFLKEHKI